jgi:hypothetical protein
MSESEKEAPQAPQAPVIEQWMTRTTAILAILAALSSGRWGASNLWAILEQGKVNDAWSYYQAKSVKQHVAESSCQLAEALHADAAVIASFKAEMKRLDADKAQAKKDAEDYQFSRDVWISRSFWFEVSFIVIQLGVVLCTIAAATRGRKLWDLAIVLGILGVAFLIWGFLVKEKTENPLTKSVVKSLDGSSK